MSRRLRTSVYFYHCCGEATGTDDYSQMDKLSHETVMINEACIKPWQASEAYCPKGFLQIKAHERMDIMMHLLDGSTWSGVAYVKNEVLHEISS